MLFGFSTMVFEQNSTNGTISYFIEASSLDQIKITKNQLEFDQIKMTTTNVNVWTWPKLYNDKH